MQQQLRVISWCLYYDESNLVRLPEYLVGLKCNQRAARVWFPGWHLRLYYNKSVRQHSSLWDYVVSIATYGDPCIELIECRDNIHPKIERYRPFFDDTVDVCIARDIDSILSKTDADIVQQWLLNSSSPVLIYREHKMTYICMGGGVGVRRSTIPLQKQQQMYAQQTDEYYLDMLLENWPAHQITQMTTTGCYYVKKGPLLWTVPFPHALRGFLSKVPGVFYETVDDVVQLCKEYPIGRHHVYAHLPQHQSDDHVEWIR